MHWKFEAEDHEFRTSMELIQRPDLKERERERGREEKERKEKEDTKKKTGKEGEKKNVDRVNWVRYHNNSSLVAFYI